MSVKEINEKHKNERTGMLGYNKHGTLMKIIKYNNSKNIVVEFQDDFKYKINTCYRSFILGNIKNPYDKTLYNMGYIGVGHKLKYNNKFTKEARLWHSMLERCYSEQYKKKKPTYKDVMCCDEWLCYQNFYEWIHNQENFDSWITLEKSAIDKDILIKGNKLYSPDTCCLVPYNVNGLFTKSDALRGKYPIGVIFNKDHNCLEVQINNSITNKREHYSNFYNVNDAFLKYKERKEEIIKQVAQEEFDKGTITRRCYEAMMNYKVEITD